MVPHLISGDTVTVFVNNKPYSAVRGSSLYDDCIQHIRANADEDAIEGLFNAEKAVATFSNGELVLTGSTVLYRGERIDGVIVERLLELMHADEPYAPLANFLVRLMRNQSRRSVETLYAFIAHSGLPICDDGRFIAWKAVRSDYMDKYTGKVSNHVGAEISCDRNKVDDDPKSACSYGYHAGTLNYAAKRYGSPSSGDRIMSVLLDPEHVVCVPHDESAQKVRVCWYKVLGEVENPLELLARLKEIGPVYRGEHGHVS